MSYWGQPSSFGLNVARGLVTGMLAVNKFGRAPLGVQTTATDIWARADAAPSQQIWLPPTAARVHAIASSSASDSSAGVGARTITIVGLTSWSTKEVSETITLNGTTTVNTVNSYVIINRMFVVTSGATAINVGNISATASVNGTVTAVILPGRGQTEQAIYGLPSTQSLYIEEWNAAITDATATTRVTFFLMRNLNPDVQGTNYLTGRSLERVNTGTNAAQVSWRTPYKVPGPAIIKIQAIANVADVQASTGFDGILVDN